MLNTNWIDKKLYPFKNQHITLSNGRMHYIDEGEGQVILFLHGTPTWSFVYREYIKTLSKSFRCIAIDHIGFGLSKPNEGFVGTPENHSKNITEFVQHLKLDEIILALHDFGGPIGLGFANENPELISKVVLHNTWLWETKTNPEIQKADKLLNTRFGKFLYLTMNISPKILLKKGFHNKRKLTKQVHKHYLKPFPTKRSRIALYQLFQSLIGSSDWYQEQWERLSSLRDKEWFIIWGTKDEFFPIEYLEKWIQKVNPKRTVRLDSGHFLQEEVPEKCILEIENFLK